MNEYRLLANPSWSVIQPDLIASAFSDKRLILPKFHGIFLGDTLTFGARVHSLWKFSRKILLPTEYADSGRFTCIVPFKISFFDHPFMLRREIRNNPRTIGSNLRVSGAFSGVSGFHYLWILFLNLSERVESGLRRFLVLAVDSSGIDRIDDKESKPNQLGNKFGVIPASALCFAGYFMAGVGWFGMHFRCRSGRDAVRWAGILVIGILTSLYGGWYWLIIGRIF